MWEIEAEGVATRPCWQPCDYAHDEADTPDHAALTDRLLFCPGCGWVVESAGYLEAGPRCRVEPEGWVVQCPNPTCAALILVEPVRDARRAS